MTPGDDSPSAGVPGPGADSASASASAGVPSAGSLAEVLGEAYPGRSVTVDRCRRLSTGASRLTLALDVTVDGRQEALVLQIDADTPGPAPAVPAAHAPALALAGSAPAGSAPAAPSEVRRTLDAGAQGAVMRRAGAAGVPVPAVVWAAAHSPALGAPAILTAAVAGETLPRRILRDESLAGARDRFAADCGRILARVQAVEVEDLGLEAPDALAAVRASLDEAAEPRPAFELAHAWLASRRPPSSPPVLVHGDFRNGNLVVAPDGVAAVLDWELAHVGDALEDLGWLCSVAWRFGADAPVGGMGRREDLYAAYEAAGGLPVSYEAARWWEVLASLSWGAICMRQARRHLLGQSRSMELAAIGRRVCESEWDLLGLLRPAATPTPEPRPPEPEPGPGPEPEPGPPEPDPGPEPEAQPPDPTGGLHGRPSAAELLEAVREWLEAELAPAAGEGHRFHLRVAARVLATVAREISLGPGQVAAHAERLRAAGYDNDAALARAIRSGGLPAGRCEELWPLVEAGVRARLAVANPGYLLRAPPG